jgi:hypothetical protein
MAKYAVSIEGLLEKLTETKVRQLDRSNSNPHPHLSEFHPENHDSDSVSFSAPPYQLI